MDVPCPKCNSTDLKKVSLAYEEWLYQGNKRAQFRGVLVGSGGPVALVGTSTTKGTKQTGLDAQSGGVGTRRICKKTSERLLSFETFVVQIPVATAASKSLLAASQQTRVAGRTFQAES
jgi:hypothetical protein